MPGPRRVLYTIPNLDTAGSGHALLSLARRLDPDRYLPTICVAERRNTDLEQAVEAAGIELAVAPVTVAARPYLTLLARARRCGRQAPGGADLWHSFHYLDDYTEPLVARSAGCRRWLYTKKNMSWGGRAWRARTWLAAGVAAQNPTMVEQFFASARAPVRVIPPGVDASTFAPGPDRPWRAKLGARPDDLVVAQVAHLLPNKRQDLVVRAVAQVRGPVQLALAGRALDRSYAARVEALADELGIGHRVHVLGPVTDVPALLRSCDAFAFASRQEACPVAVLEAMATALPVVVADIAGTRHLVADGVEGHRVPPDDPAAFAAALQAWLDDPDRRAAAGAAGRHRALTDFTLEQEAERYQGLYDEVLA